MDDPIVSLPLSFMGFEVPVHLDAPLWSSASGSNPVSQAAVRLCCGEILSSLQLIDIAIETAICTQEDSVSGVDNRRILLSKYVWDKYTWLKHLLSGAEPVICNSGQYAISLHRQFLSPSQFLHALGVSHVFVYVNTCLDTLCYPDSEILARATSSGHLAAYCTHERTRSICQCIADEISGASQKYAAHKLAILHRNLKRYAESAKELRKGIQNGFDNLKASIENGSSPSLTNESRQWVMNEVIQPTESFIVSQVLHPTWMKKYSRSIEHASVALASMISVSRVS